MKKLKKDYKEKSSQKALSKTKKKQSKNYIFNKEKPLNQKQLSQQRKKKKNSPKDPKKLSIK